MIVVISGNMTFLEAHEKTGRILNISVVSHSNNHGHSKILNYVTAPHVLICSAILASSALPFVLLPVELLQKDRRSLKIRPYQRAGRFWRDGSLRSDIPQRELQLMFHVKCTIVSQTNPHIQPFFFSPLGSPGEPTLYKQGFGWRGGFVSAAMIQFFRLDLQVYAVIDFIEMGRVHARYAAFTTVSRH